MAEANAWIKVELNPAKVRFPCVREVVGDEER